MKLSDNMVKAINKQVNAELYSAYLYMSMAEDCSYKNMPGFSNWLNMQADEEITHSKKLRSYLNQAGGKVILESIEKPKDSWKNPVELFEEVAEHEAKVTEMINDLMEIAENEKDRATIVMLQWFINEQVEEESTATEILDRIKLMKDAPAGIFMMDKELGGRAK